MTRLKRRGELVHEKRESCTQKKKKSKKVQPPQGRSYTQYTLEGRAVKSRIKQAAGQNKKTSGRIIIQRVRFGPKFHSS